MYHYYSPEGARLREKAVSEALAEGATLEVAKAAGSAVVMSATARTLEVASTASASVSASASASAVSGVARVREQMPVEKRPRW